MQHIQTLIPADVRTWLEGELTWLAICYIYDLFIYFLLLYIF